MTGGTKRRALIVRDALVLGNADRPLDPARLEAERQRLCQATGWDMRYLHYDKAARTDPIYCHGTFLDAVAEIRPDFVWYRPSVLPPLIHMNIRPEILYAARALYGARLVFGFADLSNPSAVLYSAAFASIADVAVALDGNGASLQEKLPERTVLDLWPPVDGHAFRDSGRARDIDVVVLGDPEHQSGCRDALAALQGEGVSAVASGLESEDEAGIAGTAELLNRARIAVNFARLHDTAQIRPGLLKAILCGALAFESDDDVTRRYLTPYRHYVPFGTGDLATKVRRYLANAPGSRAVVAAAKAHVASTMGEAAFWQRILAALG